MLKTIFKFLLLLLIFIFEVCIPLISEQTIPSSFITFLAPNLLILLKSFIEKILEKIPEFYVKKIKNRFKEPEIKIKLGTEVDMSDYSKTITLKIINNEEKTITIDNLIMRYKDKEIKFTLYKNYDKKLNFNKNVKKQIRDYNYYRGEQQDKIKEYDIKSGENIECITICILSPLELGSFIHDRLIDSDKIIKCKKELLKALLNESYDSIIQNIKFELPIEISNNEYNIEIKINDEFKKYIEDELRHSREKILYKILSKTKGYMYTLANKESEEIGRILKIISHESQKFIEKTFIKLCEQNKINFESYKEEPTYIGICKILLHPFKKLHKVIQKQAFKTSFLNSIKDQMLPDEYQLIITLYNIKEEIRNEYSNNEKNSDTIVIHQE